MFLDNKHYKQTVMLVKFNIRRKGYIQSPKIMEQNRTKVSFVDCENELNVEKRFWLIGNSANEIINYKKYYYFTYI